VYWQDKDFWIGYLQDYPDYLTQGETLEDLKEHLKDLYRDITGGQIPGIRKVGELVVS
jgi:predicted RNase H-like HicB family nuclease